MRRWSRATSRASATSCSSGSRARAPTASTRHPASSRWRWSTATSRSSEGSCSEHGGVGRSPIVLVLVLVPVLESPRVRRAAGVHRTDVFPSSSRHRSAHAPRPTRSATQAALQRSPWLARLLSLDARSQWLEARFTPRKTWSVCVEHEYEYEHEYDDVLYA